MSIPNSGLGGEEGLEFLAKCMSTEIFLRDFIAARHESEGANYD